MNFKTFHTTSKMNWGEANLKILQYLIANGYVTGCKKLAIDNIVFPDPRFGFATCLRTAVASKENPDGQLYEVGHGDYMRHYMVCRILDNRLFDKNGMPDTYAWSDTQLKKFLKPNTPKIGRFSEEGLKNMAIVAATLPTLEEKIAFNQSFLAFGSDCYLISTPETDGIQCIKITQELYDSGLKYWPDGWRRQEGQDPDFMSATSELEVGGLLILQKNDIGIEAYYVNPDAAKVYRVE